MSVVETLTRGVVENIAPVRRRDAIGLVRQVYELAEREFVLAPPLTVHSAEPPLLAAVWAATRETLIAGPNRPAKEAIAAAVSVINTCPFCVDIHSMMIREDATTVAIQDRAPDRIDDAMTARAVRFALGTMEPASASALATTIGTSEFPAFAGTAVLFHYLNRIVNVFMRDSSPLSAAGFLRTSARALAAATIGRTFAEVTPSAGASLPLFGTSPRTGIRWVDADASIGPALGALLHVTENALAGLASAETVAQLARNMSEWQGEQPTLGHAWLAEAIRQIPPKEQPLARLALLAGRVAYLVTENDVAAVRSVPTSDAALLRIVAWGSGAASRRLAEWIGGAS